MKSYGVDGHILEIPWNSVLLDIRIYYYYFFELDSSPPAFYRTNDPFDNFTSARILK